MREGFEPSRICSVHSILLGVMIEILFLGVHVEVLILLQILEPHSLGLGDDALELSFELAAVVQGLHQRATAEVGQLVYGVVDAHDHKDDLSDLVELFHEAQVGPGAEGGGGHGAVSGNVDVVDPGGVLLVGFHDCNLLLFLIFGLEMEPLIMAGMLGQPFNAGTDILPDRLVDLKQRLLKEHDITKVVVGGGGEQGALHVDEEGFRIADKPPKISHGGMAELFGPIDGLTNPEYSPLIYGEVEELAIGAGIHQRREDHRAAATPLRDNRERSIIRNPISVLLVFVPRLIRGQTVATSTVRNRGNTGITLIGLVRPQEPELVMVDAENTLNLVHHIGIRILLAFFDLLPSREGFVVDMHHDRSIPLSCNLVIIYHRNNILRITMIDTVNDSGASCSTQ